MVGFAEEKKRLGTVWSSLCLPGEGTTKDAKDTKGRGCLYAGLVRFGAGRKVNRRFGGEGGAADGPTPTHDSKPFLGRTVS